jgi:hypothetical protein
MKYLLLPLVLLCISTGCRDGTHRIDFVVIATVWWGESLAVNDSVQITLDNYYTDIYLTNSAGWCETSLTEEYATNETEVSYKVRAQDSLGIWSGYKEGTMTADNPNAGVTFYL